MNCVCCVAAAYVEEMTNHATVHIADDTCTWQCIACVLNGLFVARAAAPCHSVTGLCGGVQNDDSLQYLEVSSSSLLGRFSILFGIRRSEAISNHFWQKHI